ncbi:MAG: DUF3185 domain-containing protein [bacterium]
MKATMIVGIALMVLGIVALGLGGFTYTEKESVVQLGPLEVTAQEKKKFPISPAAAGVMIAGGLVLAVVGASRR